LSSPSAAIVSTPTSTTTATAAATPTATATVTSSPTPTRTPGPRSTPQATTAPSDQIAASQIEATDIEAALDWQAFVPTDTADHLATMDSAARDSGCGVPWQLLAAIARVESDFGRNMATSSAGAIGYGQFLPTSWQAFGSEGNAYDYRDALPAIALYLCQAGLPRDPRAALFAYNHADWYVDLVLNLAVRYDRMAPGMPIPDVLDVGPGEQASIPMRYGSGRDVLLQARSRTLERGVTWLGVPWRGRVAGQPIGADSLQTSALAMLHAAFGLGGKPPALSPEAATDGLARLGNTAWEDGILPVTESAWTLPQVRLHLRLGQPVVVLVNGQALPGHAPDSTSGDQLLLLIGSTPDGVIYSDSTFSSSLGYGLELGDADFTRLWDAATQPRQALAFTRAASKHQAHLREVELPAPIARTFPPPTPLPALPVTATPAPPTEVAVPDVVAVEEPAPQLAEIDTGADYSWLILVGATLVSLGAYAFRRRCARSSG
jgi:LPXTG-motif cell wall-anchored protein